MNSLEIHDFFRSLDSGIKNKMKNLSRVSFFFYERYLGKKILSLKIIKIQLNFNDPSIGILRVLSSLVF